MGSNPFQNLRAQGRKALRAFLVWGNAGKSNLELLRHITLNACVAAFITIITGLFLLRMAQGRFLTAFIELLAILFALFALWYSKRGRFDIGVMMVALSPVVLSFALVRLGMFKSAEMVPQMAMAMVTFTLVFEKNRFRLVYIFVCILLMAMAVFSAEDTAFQVLSFSIQSVGFAIVFLCYVTFFERQDATLQRSIAMLEQSNQQRQSANEALQERVEELLVFSHIMTHDLKGPLAAIHGYSELLRIAPGEGEEAAALTQEAAEGISESAESMNILISDLLAYARVSLGGTDSESVDLNEVFNAAKSMLSFQLETSKVVLECGQLPMVLGHADLYRTVLYNLLSNAIKYQPKTAGHIPRVWIWADGKEDAPTVHLKDNGVGIQEAFLPRLFAPFQRDREDEYHGSGLGMSICQGVMERFGGSIEVERTSAAGTTFKLTFSVVADAPKEASASTEASAAGRVEPSRLHT